jgi:hypothetical protein
MKWFVLPALALVALALAGLGDAKNAATICVGSSPGCFPNIQAAVDAAHDGDTIRLGPGTYDGGVVIDASIQLVGAGASATVIRGGGPVILIGAPFPWSPTRPTVSISGVTITGGVANSFPGTSVSQGGGLVITPSAPPTPGPGATGATVTVTDSVITGNLVYATELIPPGFCGPRACAFANAGGIDSSGVLTLRRTEVTDNEVLSPPGVATGVSGGGIFSHPQGTLTLDHSSVNGNQVVGAEPNGREGNGGGIDSSGDLVVDHSDVSDNTVQITSSVPADSERTAFAGGIHAGGHGATATITHSTIERNVVSASNVDNDAFAYGAALMTEIDVTLDHVTVDHNRVTATSTGGGAFADGGGIEVDAGATISHSTFDANTVTASAPGGTAFAQGGGIANAGQLLVDHTSVTNNSTVANGANGAAQGGGLWNGSFGGPPPTLAVSYSSIEGNSVAGSGVALQGGGLYSDFPVTSTKTAVAGNSPDQCVGC